MEGKSIRERLVVSSEDAFSLLVCFLWGYNTIFNFIVVFLGRIPVLGSEIRSILPPVFVAILILGSLNYIKHLVRLSDVIFGLTIFMVAFGTILIGARTTELFPELASKFLIQCVPMYYIGKVLYYKVQDKNEFVSTLATISKIGIVLFSGYYLVNGVGTNLALYDEQYIPYCLLPHLLLLMGLVFQKFSLVNLGLLVAGSLYICMLGNRGSIVCLLVMLLILVIKKTISISIFKRIVIILIIGGLIAILLFTDAYNMLLMGMYAYASSHNMSTRVFESFMGQYTSVAGFDTGRSALQLQLIQLIRENPLGYGLASDRFFIGQYAHNVFLEIVMDFGVFIGGMIVIFIVLRIIRSIKRLSFVNKEIDILFFVFLCCGMVKLFISGSYLQEPFFFLLLGLSSSIHKVPSIQIERG